MLNKLSKLVRKYKGLNLNLNPGCLIQRPSQSCHADSTIVDLELYIQYLHSYPAPDWNSRSHLTQKVPVM
jgi:hypothetical protein